MEKQEATAWSLYRKGARLTLAGLIATAQAVAATFRNIFTRYPNVAWLVITAAITVGAYIEIGKARSERDQYSRRTAALQRQLDSCLQKETRYIH